MRRAILGTDDDIGHTGDVICRGITDKSIVAPHTTTPATAKDVAGLTALNINIGGGYKVLGAIFIQYRALCARAIDVFVDLTAQQTEINCAADICRGTQTATIGIAAHPCSILDVDIGITLQAQLILLDQRVGKSFVLIFIT